jgi:pyroglutamyl-peptidase
MSTRPTILLTGFGAFPGVESNATAELVPELARTACAKFPDHDVVAEVLPVDWTRAPQALAKLLADVQPVLALHFGVSPGAKGFQIELIGRNVCGSREDAAGCLPPSGTTLIDSGPARLVTTLPAEHIVARLARRGIPSTTSNDAGTYLCNALLYHSLLAARALPQPFLSGFIHIPTDIARTDALTAGSHSLNQAAALAGGLEIIATCLESVAAARVL